LAVPPPPVTPEQARKCGERLVEIALDRIVGKGFKQKEQRLALTYGGLIVRAARFVRAAYLLADNQLRPEAAVFVRALIEYAITARWLALEPPKNFTLWAIDDMRGRLLIAEAAKRLAGVDLLEDERRREYEETQATLQGDWLAAFGEPAPKRMPSLERRARETGNHGLYEFAYRFDSQTAVHPTPFAVDQILGQTDDMIEVLGEPSADREYADPYATAAVAFLDILDAAASVTPELVFGDEVDQIRRILHGEHPANQSDTA